MEDNILQTIKHLLGIPEEYDVFDNDILVHINSVIDVLYQLGYGDGTFYLVDGSETWAQYLENAKDFNLIKTLIYLRVKLLFDPPTSSAAMQSFQNLINEFEFRVNMFVDRDISGEEV